MPPRDRSSSPEAEEQPPSRRPRTERDPQSPKAASLAPRTFLDPFARARAQKSPEAAKKSPEVARRSPEVAQRSPEAAARPSKSPEAVRKSPVAARAGNLSPEVVRAGQSSKTTPRTARNLPEATRAGESSVGQRSSAADALARMAANIGTRSSPSEHSRHGTPSITVIGQHTALGPSALGLADSAKGNNVASHKHVAQTLAQLKNTIAKLSADVNEQEADIEKNTHNVTSALALAEDAAMLAQKLDARVESLETVLMPLIARVADLETRAPVEIRESSSSESETGGQEGDDVKARKAKKAKKAKARMPSGAASDPS
ncbi:hypothetical protein BC628DRAFT_1042183 [Trametes gibbosa]|nr:hypothetical protein BC628DRAFT_1042183 [Trametes gibbosa]